MAYQKALLATAIACAMASAPALALTDAQELDQLKRQLGALLERVDQLETKTQNAEARARAAETKVETMSAHRAPAAVSSGNDKIRVSVSGHVNRAMLVVDDGKETDLYHVDNDSSSTRLRVIGEGDVSPELTVGTAIEVQLESNSTAKVSQDNESDSDNIISDRRLEVYFDHDRLGKLWMGKGWTASEDSSEMDLSGTALVGYSSTADIAGGIKFRDGAGNLSMTRVGDVFLNLDGLGRRNRLRYDTPSFAGMKLAASAVEDSAWDTALTYSADYDLGTLAAAVAYSDQQNNSGQVNGSASFLHNSGVSVTLAAGERDSDALDPNFFYGKLGYQNQWFNAGKTALSADYHVANHAVERSDKAKSVGVQMVQSVDDWATELYVGYRNYDLERAGENLDEVDALIAGARIKF
ncbi:porin [Oceanisphaera sp.]|uniref:porin n=1 Tax=Oceanisphaera sp. TaxID=1929979 RepID=UPI003A8CC4A0